MLPSQHRLPPRTTFRNASTIRQQSLLVKYSINNPGPSRIGFVISKKVDTRAVIRNRIRRVLSHSFESHVIREKAGYDILCIVKGSNSRDSDVLKKELEETLDTIITS